MATTSDRGTAGGSRALGAGMAPHRRRRRGFILIALSWVILIVALLAVTQLRDAELLLRGSRQAQDEARRRDAAVSVLALIRSSIEADREEKFDAPSEGWAWPVLAERYGVLLEEDFPGIALRVRVMDDDARVPLSAANRDRLAALLEALGLAQLAARRSADEVVAAFANVAPEKVVGQEEEKAEVPRVSLRLLREVASLEGLTLYGEDADLDGILDGNERDRDAYVPADDGDGVLDPGLEEFVTLSGSGECNLNLAPREVLLSVPGMREGIVDDVLDFRAGADGVVGSADDGVFESVEDLMRLGSVSRFREFTVDKASRYLRTTTSRFDVRVAAEDENGGLFRLRALLIRENGIVRVASWEEDQGF